MKAIQKAKSVIAIRLSVVAGIMFSGLCWYLSNGLSGNFWYLLWIAPVPVLLISFQATAKQTFVFSFLAYLIGRLSWFSYLVTVATIIPAIIFTIALPLIFAFILVLTRTMMVKVNSWVVVFAFPVFFSAFEWLMMKFSPDGTAASIAYSQSNFLPFIQIASITGMLGVTFITTFIPSAMAMCWQFRTQKSKLLPLVLITTILMATILVYGLIRTNTNPKTEKIMVGLVVLDEQTHKMGNLDFRNELEHTRHYASEISLLASRGAEFVVLPERAINVNPETDSATVSILSTCAKQNHVGIIAGYTNFRNKTAHNSALVIDKQGTINIDYNKVHLVKGLEDHFTSGTRAGLFNYDGLPAGIAICKDLDFPEYIIQYGRYKAAFVFIPAWDFVVDDWLHSRMAILRGVENGFSEVRTARLGRLTISDLYGRINAESNSSNGKSTVLVGQMSLNRINTFYSHYGDWFGWAIMIATLTFFFLMTFKEK